MGFEVTYFNVEAGGVRVEGTTTGLQEGEPWIVTYRLLLDELWCTRVANLTSMTATGVAERVLESDGRGRWQVYGRSAPELDGCLDVDLESSAMTNALPIHRLLLSVGERAAAPAVYVRAVALRVDQLEQTYTRRDDRDGSQQFDYEAPAFDFRCASSTTTVVWCSSIPG